MHWMCGMIGPKVLWISSGPNRYQAWESVFDKTDIQVQRVDELNLSMRQIDEADIDVVLVDASGIIQDDIDLCRRLRKRFDFSLILITPNLTEEFAVAAYNVGIDDCISGHISPALLRAKVDARIRFLERMPQRRGTSTSVSASKRQHTHPIGQQSIPPSM